MPRRILIFGNSGSGKTTMARRLARELALTHLDLDSLAWDESGVRSSEEASQRLITDFLQSHSSWVVEGCYGDLIEHVLPSATEVRFLNPGLEACIANCLSRPWEPEKYPSKEAQDRNLELLLDWVREYETRTDEYSLERHRRIFESFDGLKTEISGNASREALASNHASKDGIGGSG